MRHHAISIRVLAVACGLMACASAAQAAIETWVSGTGTDAGTCPITAPCRTFQFAHDRTAFNGAINVLSSGNFGPLTITRPISIVAQGVEALINTGADGAGIRVQAGPNAVVSLRGLTIDLRGTANSGISFASGAALHVHNCVIRRGTNGIGFAPASGTSELYVADSVIANAANNGIIVAPSGSGGATVVLDRVRVENGADNGIVFSGNLTTGSISATVRDSVAAGNSDTGIRAVEFGGGTTTVMIDHSGAVNNSTGILASAGATIRIGDSAVTGNAVGLNAGNATAIASYGSNQIDGNTSNGSTPDPIDYR